MNGNTLRLSDSTINLIDIGGRVFMAALFIYSGFGKLMDPGTVANRLSGAGFPLPTIAAYVAILIEFGAAATLIAGYRIVITCAVLAVYTILATALFHQFWTFDGGQRVAQTYQFLKNVCILAGLWFIVRTTLLEAARKVSGASTAASRPAAAE